MPAAPSANEFVDAGLWDRLARGRFALSVGTFEIRKNYKLLIDLLPHELVDDNTFDLDLVIVGMAGWSVEQVVEQFRLSPLFGNRIFCFKTSRTQVCRGFTNYATFLLFPSLYEGWGLPIVEALQHGRPVIASNRGAVPEAGLGSPTLLTLTIVRRGGGDNRAPRSPTRTGYYEDIPSWDDTANAVGDICCAF